MFGGGGFFDGCRCETATQGSIPEGGCSRAVDDVRPTASPQAPFPPTPKGSDVRRDELDGDTLKMCWFERDPEHRVTKFASDSRMTSTGPKEDS